MNMDVRLLFDALRKQSFAQLLCNKQVDFARPAVFEHFYEAAQRCLEASCAEDCWSYLSLDCNTKRRKAYHVTMSIACKRCRRMTEEFYPFSIKGAREGGSEGRRFGGR